jgi:hypothetical protein
MAVRSKQSPPLLSAEDAKKILQRNVTNIVKKVAAGRTISKREQDLIAQYDGVGRGEGERDWVSRERLAQELGCHPNSIPRFTTEHPDAPQDKRANGTFNLPAWRTWKTNHPEIEFKKEHALAGSLLKDEKLREQVRAIKFNQDVAEGLYLKKSEVEAWMVGALERLKYILTIKLRNEYPPKLEGLRAAEISEKMEPLIAELLEILRGNPPGRK